MAKNNHTQMQRILLEDAQKSISDAYTFINRYLGLGKDPHGVCVSGWENISIKISKIHNLVTKQTLAICEKEARNGKT